MAEERPQSNFALLQQAVLAWRTARGFDTGHTPTKLSHSLMVEAAELGRHFLWNKGEDGHTPEELEAISEELADVLYHVLVLSHDLNIDIVSAMYEKLEKSGKKYPPIDKS